MTVIDVPDGYELVQAGEDCIEHLARNNVECALAGGLTLDYDTVLRGVKKTLRLPNCLYFILRDSTTKHIIAQYKQVWTWNDFFARDAVWMEHLFVKPAFRRRNVARVLVEHFVGSAREQSSEEKGGFPLLLVHKDNKGAKALYESCGFVDLQYCWMIHTRSWKEPGPESA